jgi:S1-C subfamily serine protease
MRATLAVVVAAGVAGGLAGGAIGMALGGTGGPREPARGRPAARAEAVQTAPRARRGLTPEQAYRADAPGVVVITDTQTQVVPPTLFTPARRQQVAALGSGFVVDANGDVVTNDHVVQGARNIRVGFTGDVTYPATLVGTDPSTDVAVIRVHAAAGALHPLRFDDSSTVQVGDPVYAIGNPFGLDRTMTAGIVSATAREIEAPNGLTIANAIQTDAPINHGNSGGPLLNRYGRVVGINAQIEGGTVDANVGIGFAIPGNTARSVADQLIATGHAQHPWLGVEVRAIDPGVAALVRGLPPRGVVVVRVAPHSPAAKAGLRRARREVTVDGSTAFVGGDAIVAADGRPVATTSELGDAVARRRPGDTLRLEVVRGAARRSVDVTLGDVPA